jgi:hypothetical protein
LSTFSSANNSRGFARKRTLAITSADAGEKLLCGAKPKYWSYKVVQHNKRLGPLFGGGSPMGVSLPGLGSPGLGSPGGSFTGGFLRLGGGFIGGFLGSLGGSRRGSSRFRTVAVAFKIMAIAVVSSLTSRTSPCLQLLFQRNRKQFQNFLTRFSLPAQSPRSSWPSPYFSFLSRCCCLYGAGSGACHHKLSSQPTSKNSVRRSCFYVFRCE